MEMKLCRKFEKFSILISIKLNFSLDQFSSTHIYTTLLFDFLWVILSLILFRYIKSWKSIVEFENNSSFLLSKHTISYNQSRNLSQNLFVHPPLHSFLLKNREIIFLHLSPLRKILCHYSISYVQSWFIESFSLFYNKEIAKWILEGKSKNQSVEKIKHKRIENIFRDLLFL